MNATDEARCLEQALARKYGVSVHASGKGYELFIRELGLRHTCSNLATGHAELLAKKDALIRDLAAEGLWDWITPPGVQAEQEPMKTWRWRDMAPFLIKCACVVLLVLWISARISNALRDVGWGLEKKIGDVIMLQEDKERALLQRTRAFASKLRPFVQELMVVFKSDAELDAASSPQPASDIPSKGAGER